MQNLMYRGIFSGVTERSEGLLTRLSTSRTILIMAKNLKPNCLLSAGQRTCDCVLFSCPIAQYCSVLSSLLSGPKEFWGRNTTQELRYKSPGKGYPPAGLISHKSQSTGLQTGVPRASGAAPRPTPQQKCIPLASATRPRPAGVSIAQLGSSQVQTSDEHLYPPPGRIRGGTRLGSTTATPNLFPRWLLPAHRRRRTPEQAPPL